jgi:hypothetical protein
MQAGEIRAMFGTSLWSLQNSYYRNKRGLEMKIAMGMF